MTMQPERNAAGAVPQIAIKLVQDDRPVVEQGLRDAFAASLAASTDSQAVAAHAARLLGNGCIVTVEAERAGWSRYRVAVRGYLLGQGAPVTIATIEVTQPD